MGLFRQGFRKIGIKRIHKALGIEPWLVRADEHGKILGHLAAFDSVDNDLFQGLREMLDLRGLIKNRRDA